MSKPELRRSVRRLVIPADQQWHGFDLTGPILHLAARNGRHVDMFVMHQQGHGAFTFRRSFRLFETGEQLTEGCGDHVGSVVPPNGMPLGWHIFEEAPR